MRTKQIAVAAFVSLALLPGAYAKSANKTHQPDKPQPSITDIRGTEASPLVVKAITLSPQEDIRGTEAAPIIIKTLENEGSWISPDGVIAIFTVLLALIAFGQLFVFGRQATRLRETVDEMKKGTAATEKAADAAKRSADVSEKALIDVERAWVFSSFIVQNYNSANVAKILFIVYNFGRTPAIVKEIYAEFSSVEPSDDTAVYSDGESVKLDEIVPPTADIPEQNSPFSHVFTSAKPNLKFFYGYVKYLDIFQRPHTYRFCTSITGVNQNCKSTENQVYNAYD